MAGRHATKAGEALANKTEPQIHVEQALHVLEISEAAREFSESGMRIPHKNSFKWPLV